MSTTPPEDRADVEYLAPPPTDGAVVAVLRAGGATAEVRVERVDRNHGERWTYLVREGRRLLFPCNSPVSYGSFEVAAQQARHAAPSYARRLAERARAS
jgi:hypothetical protein